MTDPDDPLPPFLREIESDDSVKAEALRLAWTAGYDALGRVYPRPSLARLDWLAEQEDGDALLYAMFMTWLDWWMSTLRAAFPTLPFDQTFYQWFARRHIPPPEEGFNERAAEVIREVISLRCTEAEAQAQDEIDGCDHESEDTDRAAGALFLYVRDNILRPGRHVQDECAVVLLFMIKRAYVDGRMVGAITVGGVRRGWGPNAVTIVETPTRVSDAEHPGAGPEPEDR